MSPPIEIFSGVVVDKLRISPNGKIRFLEGSECDSQKQITFTGLHLDFNKFDDVAICVDTIGPGRDGKCEKNEKMKLTNCKKN